ncbi:MAG: response regulator transcription factor [Acidobacteria bacterium]|nr:response regulator transcription factor [Acidobacteriota bacterium]
MRVLVIEDEVKMASLVERGLKEEGMAVDVVHDGEDGFIQALQFPYDVIILDLMLPSMGGLEVCRRLRESQVHTPILILTARDDLETRVQGLDLGADDYLTKPFAFVELVARIRALIRRSRQDTSPVLRVADLMLDPVARKVMRSGKEILLTAKEFALLECLMQNPNRVLSRTVLSEKVWDLSFDTLTNVIDVYINYLRNKIDRDFEPKLIHTIRGAGYMLKEPGN